MRRCWYVMCDGATGMAVTTVLIELPTALTVVLLVLAVLVGGVLAELQRRRDHELGMHAVDQRADPALIEALHRRQRP